MKVPRSEMEEKRGTGELFFLISLQIFVFIFHTLEFEMWIFIKILSISYISTRLSEINYENYNKLFFH